MKSFMVFVSLLILCVFIAFCGAGLGYILAMEEAFNRGYAMECLGKNGYYWTCEEDN